MVRVHLHAGLHKTGTTAIQECAWANRRRLLRQGLLYPGFGPFVWRNAPAHHRFAHALVEQDDKLSAADTGPLVEAWHARARRRGADILLSSESICRHVVSDGGKDWFSRRRQYLARVAESLQNFEVSPILVLRRQDEFVRSLYQEHVMKGTTRLGKLDFPGFRKRVSRSRLRFLDNLRLFEDVFGAVRVLTYEELAENGLLTSFFAALGLPDLKVRNRRVVRPSLTVAETLIKQRLNRHVKSPAANDKLLAWLRSRKVRRILESSFDGTESLWSSYDEQAAFQQTWMEENRLIAEAFRNGHKPLFPRLAAWGDDQLPAPSHADVSRALERAVAASPRKLKSVIGSNALAALG